MKGNLGTSTASINSITFIPKYCRGYRRNLIVRVALLLLVVLLFHFIYFDAQEYFIAVRSGFVHLFHSIAVTLPMGDTSKHSLWTKSPEHMMGIKPNEVGGCIWDVGANDGTWESNSYYPVYKKSFHAWLFEPDPKTFMKLRSMYGRIHTDQLVDQSPSSRAKSHSSSSFVGQSARNDGRGSSAKSNSNKITAVPVGKRVQIFNVALSDATSLTSFQEYPMGHENSFEKYQHRPKFDKPIYAYSVPAFDAQLLCEQHKQAIAQGWCVVSNVDDKSVIAGGNERSHQSMRGSAAATTSKVSSSSPPQEYKSSTSRTYTVLSIDTEGNDAAILQAAHRNGGCVWDRLIVETPGLPRDTFKAWGYEFVDVQGYNHIFKKTTALSR